MKKVVIFIIFLLLINSVSAYEIEYMHQDNLGNNVAITNEEGNVIWKSDYEPFGSSFNEEGNNNYKYNNKELDSSTDLLYYGARYYDADIGRFTTADTVAGSVNNPQSLNRYAYVQNNPMKYVDPTGNEPRIKDEGFATLNLISKTYSDTLIYGSNFQNLNTKLPFSDLDSIEKNRQTVNVNIRSDMLNNNLYQTNIPKYAVDGVPSFISRTFGNILGTVEATPTIQLHQVIYYWKDKSAPDFAVFSVVSGSLTIDLNGVLNKLGFPDMDVTSAALIPALNGKVYAFGVAPIFTKDAGGKKVFSGDPNEIMYGFMDLESEKLYSNVELFGEGANKQDFPQEVISAAKDIFIGEYQRLKGNK